MHLDYLGDSYDLVKRFFGLELRALGYHVSVDPLFTGEWFGSEDQYYRLIGADHRSQPQILGNRTALLIDPDKGISTTRTPKHVSFVKIADEAARHTLVVCFDQSFSRNKDPIAAMKQKLLALAELKVAGLYYDSHARFLFAARSTSEIQRIRRHLEQVGIPARRLISCDP